MPAGRWRRRTALICSRSVASSAKARRTCSRAIARWRGPTWDCEVLATASLRSAVTTPAPARLVKDGSRRTIADKQETNRRGDAMQVFMFHLMPYADLDMGYTDKH